MNALHSAPDLGADSVQPLGFADPVHDAQQSFRVLLMALARPCIPQAMPQHLPHPPAPLSPTVAAALLCLCDGDTPLWLAPAYNTPDICAWLRFHTGCPLTTTPDQAMFAAAPAFDALPPLAVFAQGDPAWPDRSTTLLVGIPDISGMAVPDKSSFTAMGPGIQERVTLTLPSDTLPRDFDQQWAANNTAYPLGVDLLVLSSAHVFGLPRTTRLMPLI